VERRLYNSFVGLLGVVGCALALRLLWLWNSIPALVMGRSRFHPYFISKNDYVGAVLVDALLLPVVCAFFAYIAHLGMQLDIVSWFFVAGFYGLVGWLWSDVSSSLHQVSAPRTRNGFSVGVQSPLFFLFVAVAMGIGFWKWKQSWDFGS
jgi:hypothetical protein